MIDEEKDFVLEPKNNETKYKKNNNKAKKIYTSTNYQEADATPQTPPLIRSRNHRIYNPEEKKRDFYHLFPFSIDKYIQNGGVMIGRQNSTYRDNIDIQCNLGATIREADGTITNVIFHNTIDENGRYYHRGFNNIEDHAFVNDLFNTYFRETKSTNQRILDLRRSINDCITKKANQNKAEDNTYTLIETDYALEIYDPQFNVYITIYKKNNNTDDN